MINKGMKRILLLSFIVTGVMALAGLIISGPAAGGIILLASAGISVVFLVYTGRRYKDLEEMNTYLSSVLAGRYDLRPAVNEEGELSLLRNNIYKATLRLQSQNDLLRAEKVYLADMMADISHQLKTPLTSLMMMNDLLEKETSPEKRADFIEIERRQTERMSWLIQTLLKLSRLDAGTVELKQELTSVSALVKESIEPFLIQMDICGLGLADMTDGTGCRCDENERPGADGQEQICLMADRTWTVEALRNIIKNCIEHMERGGRLKIQAEENNLYVAVHISDTGCGIRPEDLPHIFERFYRGKGSSPESAGIGLALAKTIIEKQRGRILADSVPGQGSHFEIRFYKAVV